MPTTTSSSAADYASMLRSEQASLEAALSFLAECDDGTSGGSAGAAWRLLQDASSHDDMDVDIDEGGDEPQRHHHHVHHHVRDSYVRDDNDDDDEDSDDAAMLSALLEAEHIPVIETPGASVPSSSFHEAARASGYTSFHTSSSGNAYGFADESLTTDYQPHHNPGMMMAMMSAGFPTIDFNPQSLLMAPDDSSGSESNSPTAALSAASLAANGGATAADYATTPTAAGRPRATSASTALVKKRPAKKKPAGYNSNRARDERKEELIYLRKTVLEMEGRLNKLKQSVPAVVAAANPPQVLSAAADFSPNSSSSSTASCSSSKSTSMTTAIQTAAAATPAQARASAAAQQLSSSVWEDIATRQYKERRRAELENIRLKLILEGQIKMAKALEKILKKRTSLRVSPCFLYRPSSMMS